MVKDIQVNNLKNSLELRQVIEDEVLSKLDSVVKIHNINRNGDMSLKLYEFIDKPIEVGVIHTNKTFTLHNPVLVIDIIINTTQSKLGYQQDKLQHIRTKNKKLSNIYHSSNIIERIENAGDVFGWLSCNKYMGYLEKILNGLWWIFTGLMFQTTDMQFLLDLADTINKSNNVKYKIKQLQIELDTVTNMEQYLLKDYIKLYDGLSMYGCVSIDSATLRDDTLL